MSVSFNALEYIDQAFGWQKYLLTPGNDKKEDFQKNLKNAHFFAKDFGKKINACGDIITKEFCQPILDEIVKTIAKVSAASNPIFEEKKLTLEPIVIHFPLNHGDTLYLRGGDGGLSWNQGLPMQEGPKGVWKWTPKEEQKKGMEYKVLVNDQIWEEGENRKIDGKTVPNRTPIFPSSYKNNASSVSAFQAQVPSNASATSAVAERVLVTRPTPSLSFPQVRSILSPQTEEAIPVLVDGLFLARELSCVLDGDQALHIAHTSFDTDCVMWGMQNLVDRAEKCQELLTQHGITDLAEKIGELTNYARRGMTKALESSIEKTLQNDEKITHFAMEKPELKKAIYFQRKRLHEENVKYLQDNPGRVQKAILEEIQGQIDHLNRFIGSYQPSPQMQREATFYIETYNLHSTLVHLLHPSSVQKLRSLNTYSRDIFILNYFDKLQFDANELMQSATNSPSHPLKEKTLAQAGEFIKSLLPQLIRLSFDATEENDQSIAQQLQEIPFHKDIADHIRKKRIAITEHNVKMIPSESARLEKVQNIYFPSRALATATTRIALTCQLNPSDRLFIRGSAAPLSWSKGIEMQRSSEGSWYIDLPLSSRSDLEFKFILNDTTWEEGVNRIFDASKPNLKTPVFKSPSPAPASAAAKRPSFSASTFFPIVPSIERLASEAQVEPAAQGLLCALKLSQMQDMQPCFDFAKISFESDCVQWGIQSLIEDANKTIAMLEKENLLDLAQMIRSYLAPVEQRYPEALELSIERTLDNDQGLIFEAQKISSELAQAVILERLELHEGNVTFIQQNPICKGAGALCQRLQRQILSYKNSLQRTVMKEHLRMSAKKFIRAYNLHTTLRSTLEDAKRQTLQSLGTHHKDIFILKYFDELNFDVSETQKSLRSLPYLPFVAELEGQMQAFEHRLKEYVSFSLNATKENDRAIAKELSVASQNRSVDPRVIAKIRQIRLAITENNVQFVARQESRLTEAQALFKA